MKQCILILWILLVGCNSQVKEKPAEKDYEFSQLGWSLKVPASFEIMDSAKIARLTERGQKAIENTYDTSFNFSETKTLISFKQGQLNTFTATITPFDVTKD